MKNSLKVALGFLAGGTLILISQLVKSKKHKNITFTAPDGNCYKENEMYRNSQGQIFRNGKQMHFETPEILSQANLHIDSQYNRKIFYNDNNSFSKNINYYQKGIRHH